ncbi:hypothetical protein [Streptomyces sp. NBC_01477]|uniref:hypothetical protein n=1 Tax=Streptomyces sp. NBC_01477 TaxID=2976015 RepID=UPI002E30CB09|nr:hypothetical protein [Streptomyces sp. NBC_01477]
MLERDFGGRGTMGPLRFGAGDGRHGGIDMVYGQGDAVEEGGRSGARTAAGIEVVGKVVESAAGGSEAAVGGHQGFEAAAFVVDAGTSAGPGVRHGCGCGEAARRELAGVCCGGDLGPFVVAEAGVDAVAARDGEASSVVGDGFGNGGDWGSACVGFWAGSG